MAKSEELISAEWKELDSIGHILELVRSHEYDIYTYLAETVAALCGIDVDKMLAFNSKIYVIQPRWLFWYAYRYMTGETFEKIAEMTKNKGNYYFTPNSICHSINKMSALIESAPLWKKRWTIIKRIIKLRDANVEEQVDNTIVIQVPRDIKDKIQISIKEK